MVIIHHIITITHSALAMQDMGVPKPSGKKQLRLSYKPVRAFLASPAQAKTLAASVYAYDGCGALFLGRDHKRGQV